jgi:hypothetical protein
MDKKGYSYKFEEKTGIWGTPRSEEDMLDLCQTLLSDNGLKGEEGIMRSILSPYRNPETGLYPCRSPFQVEILVWLRDGAK